MLGEDDRGGLILIKGGKTRRGKVIGKPRNLSGQTVGESGTEECVIKKKTGGLGGKRTVAAGPGGICQLCRTDGRDGGNRKPVRRASGGLKALVCNTFWGLGCCPSKNLSALEEKFKTNYGIFRS